MNEPGISPVNSATTTIAVVVTYEPGSLGGLLEALTPQCEAVVVVDNGSAAPGLERAREACAAHGARLIELGENLGIAAAQNRGIAAARDQGARYVLLSDQDSIPSPTMVAQLLEAIEEDARIAAVGPLPTEEREGADELVYVDRGWSPKRATRAELSRPRLDVAFLIASGCLVRMSALEEIGPMREDLFIDHVDLEWGVRARRAGWRLVAVPAARLTHSLGDEVVRLPGREQPIHVHAPIRNYYILRNTLALVGRGSTLPARWRVRYSYWAAKYALFNAALPDRRAERHRMLRRGLADGLRRRLGPYASRHPDR